MITEAQICDIFDRVKALDDETKAIYKAQREIMDPLRDPALAVLNEINEMTRGMDYELRKTLESLHIEINGCCDMPEIIEKNRLGLRYFNERIYAEGSLLENEREWHISCPVSFLYENEWRDTLIAACDQERKHKESVRERVKLEKEEAEKALLKSLKDKYE